LTLINSFKAHSGFVNRIKPSPFNSFIATLSFDNTSKIWNPSLNSNWTLIQTYTEHTSWIYGLEYINEDTMATGGGDQKLKIWSITTGLTIRTISPGTNVWSLQLLSNGVHLAAGLQNGHINIYNVNNGSLLSTLIGHESWIADLTLISNNLLASSGYDNITRIWDLTTNTLKFNLIGHTQTVRSLKLVSCEVLASGSFDSTIKFWNITSEALIRTLTNHTLQIGWSIDMLDSETFVSGSMDQNIKLWNWKTGECLRTIKANLNILSLAVLNSSTSKIYRFSLNLIVIKRV
jgi:WD40 repeat protein